MASRSSRCGGVGDGTSFAWRRGSYAGVCVVVRSKPVQQIASVTPNKAVTSDVDPAPPSSSDPRRGRILATSIYRELRSAGMNEQEVIAVATELLSQVARDLRAARS